MTLRTCLFIGLSLSCICFANAQQDFTQYVNPFIGTSNFGATHPGAIAPRGMASVSPFNVAGDDTDLEKDSRWLSNPYVYENSFLTGFSHVNMSGVGCPDLGVILSMPTTGALETDHLRYGTTYKNEIAKPGYYSVELDNGIKTELTASTRVGVSRYHFPAGKANLLLNLGLGLTNEHGAVLKFNSPTEVEGSRMVGSFCYNNAESAYPIYFVARVSAAPENFGIWDKPATYNGVEAQWMTYNGKTRLKEQFMKEVVGDSIGAYFNYDFKEATQVTLKVGISYVSIANARENLDKEVGASDFDAVYAETKKAWNDKLGVVEVTGDDRDDKTIFYTALYHTQIAPSILNDANGEYPEMNTRKTKHTGGTRYTVFSLWDTYRNYHQLMSLLYPQEQLDMVNSMLAIYDENGWLPKWELNATETFTMVGDPAAVVLADTYLRGITGFDVQKAYKAMLKSADTREANPLRPGIGEYIDLGYVSYDSHIKGPVSTTQEYNIADYAIARLAEALGDKKTAKRFDQRALSYKKLYNKKSGFLQPKMGDGSWYEPFDPLAGANFTENPGFIEGNAWQYLFMQPQDIEGMIQLMGGNQKFEAKLDALFKQGQFDMANEPDIAYPFLYNYLPGKAHKTREKVDELIATYFTNKPAGLPGNDDTGTMSAWLVYAMMGFYPMTPADPGYTLTQPQFEEVIIHLNPQFYERDALVIKNERSRESEASGTFSLNGKSLSTKYVDHKTWVEAGEVIFK
ncbi:GH92 family glycosyl hydrolase [Leeuwenhoekiella nanhaiensis]|uniref:Alpha-mannosidase n=1 Tax=Leeuwenhoekiella nanhaiensis TaxID=1655491 RepID=A0A2G1VPY8_9FLAO|nr:GH92 family glycosyl hydrolase [Leeuwenhoekiella nanhaiensis]PHQ28831.1 alpha-mannosidase [Leeuwenhoekiella nanhaiensis]